MDVRLESDALLALWERGLATPAAERADALLDACGVAPPRTLGERNARLLGLHAQLFGPVLALRSHCPECASAAEFEIDCDALAREIAVTDASSPHRLVVGDHRLEFRLPSPADLAAAADCTTPEAFGLRVVERCVVACTVDERSVAVREIDSDVLDSLSARMEALDPGAVVAFAVACPNCDASWNARCDVADALWQKVETAAERVLLEIDTLARAYGWTEPDVLRLTPMRRAAYLQLSA